MKDYATINGHRTEISSGRGDKAVGIVALIILLAALTFFIWIGGIIMSNSTVPSEVLPTLGTVDVSESLTGPVELRNEHGGEYYTVVKPDKFIMMGADNVALGIVEVR